MAIINFIRPYERLAKFQLGRFVGMQGPGVVWVIPVLQSATKVDTRELFFDVPPQTNITKDNANVDVDFVIYLRVVEPEKTVLEIQNFLGASRQLATTTLRAVLGEMDLDEVLSRREYINAQMQVKLDEVTNRWGVKVTAVEIREISPPPQIQEAMTRQMSAERTRRADITESEGTRDSQINVADGDKQSQILRAEGDRASAILRAEGARQSAILEAEGFAQAMRNVNEAAQDVHANTMGLQYLDMLRTLGQGESTKWIIPMEFANVAKSIGDRLMAMTGSSGSSDGEGQSS